MEVMVVAPKIGMPDAAFWKGKKVLVTGHTGFKGGWLVIWLHRMGAQVSGLSMPPLTSPNLFELALVDEVCDNYVCDLRDQAKVEQLVSKIKPEIVFHLAAQSLVRESYKFPIDTFSTNVMGTAHLLEAIRNIDSVRVGVMITTDKVYKNNEWWKNNFNLIENFWNLVIYYRKNGITELINKNNKKKNINSENYKKKNIDTYTFLSDSDN